MTNSNLDNIITALLSGKTIYTYERELYNRSTENKVDFYSFYRLSPVEWVTNGEVTHRPWTHDLFCSTEKIEGKLLMNNSPSWDPKEDENDERAPDNWCYLPGVQRELERLGLIDSEEQRKRDPDLDQVRLPVNAEGFLKLKLS